MYDESNVKKLTKAQEELVLLDEFRTSLRCVAGRVGVKASNLAGHVFYAVKAVRNVKACPLVYDRALFGT